MDLNNNPQKTHREKRAKYRKIFLCVLMFLILYIGSYTILTCMGNYIWSQSGEYRWNTSYVSVTDVLIWKPKLIWWRIFRNIDGEYAVQANLLGYLYTPLIYVDQIYIHKTKRIFPFLEEYDIKGNDPNKL